MTRLRIHISKTYLPEGAPLVTEISNARYTEPLPVLANQLVPCEVEVEPGLCSIRVFTTWGDVTSRSVIAIPDQITDTVLRLHSRGEEEASGRSAQAPEHAETIDVSLRYLHGYHSGLF